MCEKLHIKVRNYILKSVISPILVKFNYVNYSLSFSFFSFFKKEQIDN